MTWGPWLWENRELWRPAVAGVLFVLVVTGALSLTSILRSKVGRARLIGLWIFALAAFLPARAIGTSRSYGVLVVYALMLSPILVCLYLILTVAPYRRLGQ